jgi:hypothetical protein
MCGGLAERRIDEALSTLQFLMVVILIKMQLISLMEYMWMRTRKIMK